MVQELLSTIDRSTNGGFWRDGPDRQHGNLINTPLL